MGAAPTAAQAAEYASDTCGGVHGTQQPAILQRCEQELEAFYANHRESLARTTEPSDGRLAAFATLWRATNEMRYGGQERTRKVILMAVREHLGLEAAAFQRYCAGDDDAAAAVLRNPDLMDVVGGYDGAELTLDLPDPGPVVEGFFHTVAIRQQSGWANDAAIGVAEREPMRRWTAAMNENRVRFFVLVLDRIAHPDLAWSVVTDIVEPQLRHGQRLGRLVVQWDDIQDPRVLEPLRVLAALFAEGAPPARPLDELSLVGVTKRGSEWKSTAAPAALVAALRAPALRYRDLHIQAPLLVRRAFNNANNASLLETALPQGPTRVVFDTIDNVDHGFVAAVCPPANLSLETVIVSCLQLHSDELRNHPRDVPHLRMDLSWDWEYPHTTPNYFPHLRATRLLHICCGMNVRRRASDEAIDREWAWRMQPCPDPAETVTTVLCVSPTGSRGKPEVVHRHLMRIPAIRDRFYVVITLEDVAVTEEQWADLRRSNHHLVVTHPTQGTRVGAGLVATLADALAPVDQTFGLRHHHRQPPPNGGD